MHWASLAVIFVLSAASSASAYSREELVCPVRAEWRDGSIDCPCERDWRPTDAELRQVIADHQIWLSAIETVDEGTHIAGQAILCNANLRQANLSRANLREADLSWANLRQANLLRANLQRAELGGVNLQAVNLFGANLQQAELGGGNLQQANLSLAELHGARLSGANLQGANLTLAILQGADISLADLQEAHLSGVDVEGARLAGSNLERSVYAPASPPPYQHVEGLKGLATVSFPPGGQSGLVQLRELLKDAGLRDLERQATFAIERNRSRHARCGLSDDQLREQCFAEMPVSARLGGWFELILFEWTTGWGLHPSRALIIMLATAAVFGLVVYPSAIAASPRFASPKHGIFQVWTTEEYGDPQGLVTDVDDLRISRLSADVPWAFTWGLWFSLLSAFHIGWRDLNFGIWLSRLQPSPFALRARGWVRVVSGVQSLLSVYLIAIWALTCFGRPFQ